MFLLLLALLCGLEYGFSNRLRFEVSGYSEKTLDLSTAILTGGAYQTDAGIYLPQGASVTFYGDVQIEAADVSVTAVSEELKVLEVTLSTMDDANKESYRTYVDGRVYTDEPSYFRLHSSGDIRTLRLKCVSGGPALLTDVTVNRCPPVSFSFVRVLLLYALLLGIWCIRHFGAWKLWYHRRNSRHRLALAAVLLLCLATLFVCCAGAGLNPVPYTDMTPNAYEQVFCSLLEGKVELDVDCDTALLDSLEDPYDYTERSSVMEPFGSFWDRAYYEGHFYCYFGIAPVILFFFPIYWLTGCTPNMTLLVLLLLLIGTLALFGALLKMLRYFRVRVPLLVLCLGFPVLMFGSLFPMIAVSADIYYAAVASGLAFFSLTIYCAFSALCSGRPVVRRLLFALSGVCLALTVASRPTVVLYAALLIPPFLVVLVERGRCAVAKLLDASSFLLPLAIGIFPVLLYNQIRFSSPFEFGATYQLTFSDISYNRLTPALLGETLIHYFLQTPQWSGLFPYLRPSWLGLNTYGSYFYSVNSIGAFCFPLAWAGFAQGFVTKKQPVKKATYLLMFLLPFMVAFCDLCLGGVNIRYIADILLPLMLVGLLVLAELTGKVINRCSDGTSWRFFCACFAVLLLTFGVSFALLFANERNWIYQYTPAVFRFFESLFS